MNPSTPARAHAWRISSRRPDMELFGKRSLFFALSRAPWWLSLLVAAALFMLVRQFMPDYAALASTLPLLGISAYAGWRQSRVLSPNRAAETLADLRALSWQEFAAMMEAAFRSEGYAVVSLERSVADFQLSKGGRVALASCRRWKVAQTGIDALRELSLAREKAQAQECIYVAAGELSQNARQFAAENNIRLLCDAELAQLLARTKPGKRNLRQ